MNATPTPQPVENAKLIATLTPVIEFLSKGIGAVAIALYVCGFLIVSLHYSKYGFVETNPFRPRIVAAGAWFFLFTAIPEELLLLALDPATGTTAQPQSLDLGLAGAQLVELALAGRIAPDGDRIAVVVPRPTGDPTLDCALELLRRRGAPAIAAARPAR